MAESSLHTNADNMAHNTVIDANNLRRSFWPGIWLSSILVLLLLCGQLFGAERIALLIGNTGYSEQVGSLINPAEDIELVEQALKKIGFSESNIDKLPNGDLAGTTIAVNRYVNRLREAGNGVIGFFYYSGHGAADPKTNVNYLIPVDVKSTEEKELWEKSIPLNRLIDNLRNEAPNATHLIVFDACRNGLTIKRPGIKGPYHPKGFVPENVRPGMLIAYATAEGQTAPDDGVFAKHLAKGLVKRNVEVIHMFRDLQLEVEQETQQVPWVSNSAFPKIFLAGQDDNIPVQPTPPSNQPIEPSSAKSIKTIFTNDFGMEFIFVSIDSIEKNSLPKGISRSFWVQTTEVTQKQYYTVMKSNPSKFSKCGDDCPVENVSWDDAQEFIKNLNKMYNTGEYRLPTVAEWEYVCNLNTSNIFSFGNKDETIVNYAWVRQNSEGSTHLVKRKNPPNSLNIYDIHGNVWEFCHEFDDKSFYDKESSNSLPKSSNSFVLKGGSWKDFHLYARCKYNELELAKDSKTAENNIGFRCVSDRKTN